MPNSNDDTSHARARELLGIPDDYRPRSSEQYIFLQMYIRDTAQDKIVKKLAGDEPMKGILALQDISLRAQADIREEMKLKAPSADVDDVTIGYEIPLPIPKIPEIEA